MIRLPRLLRRYPWLVGAVAVAAAPALVFALLLRGQHATIERQQEQIDQVRRNVAENCGMTREFAGWPALAAERARATPGRTADPALLAFGQLAAGTYERAGCVEHLGPLPTPASPVGTPPG